MCVFSIINSLHIIYLNAYCMFNAFSNNVPCMFIASFSQEQSFFGNVPSTDISRFASEAIARNVRRINIAMTFYFYTINCHFKVFRHLVYAYA